MVEKERPDLVVFGHSSYGWDLAPRLALALRAAQASEVVEVEEGAFVVPVCNGKLRRQVRPSAGTVVTLQAGAFTLAEEPAGTPLVESRRRAAGGVELVGYEAAAKGEVDLSRAEVIVSAGRGVGKPENVAVIAALAEAFGGDSAPAGRWSTPAGPTTVARWGPPGRRSRPSSTSPAASPAPSSTWPG